MITHDCSADIDQRFSNPRETFTSSSMGMISDKTADCKIYAYFALWNVSIKLAENSQLTSILE